jgi:transketolase
MVLLHSFHGCGRILNYMKKDRKIAKKDLMVYTHKLAKKIRVLVVDMAYRSNTGHVGSSLSISDILAVLYDQILDINPKYPDYPDRDRFILSKGHAAAGLYAVLALKKFFPKSILKAYCVDGGILPGHPTKGTIPGVEFSTGSLGHGLSVAAGIASVLEKRDSPARVYVLMGNGECNEGSVWEAAMYIATHNLTRVTAIVDDNTYQGFWDSSNKKVSLDRMWRSFGWEVISINGHNIKAVKKALEESRKNEKPTLVYARTVSGYGIPDIENTLAAHYWVPDISAWKKMRRSSL